MKLDDVTIDDILKKYKFHKILNHYLAQFFLPNNSEYKYLICAVEIAHLIIAFAITFYIFAPPGLLPYFIIFHIGVYLHWIFLKDCVIHKFTTELCETSERRHLPISWSIIKLYSKFVICLAIFIYIKPQFSPFFLLHWIVKRLYVYA